jgi:hypothetical protein
MTYEQLDEFFIQILKNILSDTKECKEYVKDLHTPEYDEINQDYDDSIKLLTRLISTTKTIDDLAELDEDTITLVYDLIASYADNFLISSNPAQKKKDIKEYEKLEELMSLFLDADDDFEDEASDE